MSEIPDPTQMSPQQREEHLDRSPEAIESRTGLAGQVVEYKRRHPDKVAEVAAKGAARRNPVPHVSSTVASVREAMAALPKITEAEASARAAEWRAEYDAAQAAELRASRAGEWKKRCPARFREPFDFARVNLEADPKALRRVLEWQFSDRGLYVLGASGHSKTRAVYALLQRLYVEEGRRVHFLDGIGFANEAAAAWRNVDTTEAWLATMQRPKVLLLDDIAKKWTPSTEEAAFAVLDRRGAALLPTLITLNYTGDQMREMSSDQAVIEPFLRRVGDYCEIVTV